MTTISQAGDFSILLQNGDRSHLVFFLKFQNFSVRTVKRLQYASPYNFIAIGQTIAEIWRFFDFSKRRPPPSCIFKITTFNGRNDQWVKLRHRAKCSSFVTACRILQAVVKANS